MLDAKKDGLTCPVVSGTDLYVGGKIENILNGNVAFGYSFEKFAVNRLVDAGILIQTNNANRNRVFAYEDYLAILRKDT